jgi:hypothetical protein
MFLAYWRGVSKATAPFSRTGMTLLFVCYLAPIIFKKAEFALYGQMVALSDLDFFEPLTAKGAAMSNPR